MEDVTLYEQAAAIACFLDLMTPEQEHFTPEEILRKGSPELIRAIYRKLHNGI